MYTNRALQQCNDRHRDVKIPAQPSMCRVYCRKYHFKKSVHHTIIFIIPGACSRNIFLKNDQFLFIRIVSLFFPVCDMV